MNKPDLKRWHPENTLFGYNMKPTIDGDFVLFCHVEQLMSRAAELSDLCERLKQEAQIHAQEARTANGTIGKIYQVVTGKTGEPGNWNGAEPVRIALKARESRIADLEAALHQIKRIAQYPPQDRHVLKIATQALDLHDKEAEC